MRRNKGVLRNMESKMDTGVYSQKKTIEIPVTDVEKTEHRKFDIHGHSESKS